MFLHLDLAELIRTVGYIGIFFMVFAESGLFFGFFFPGDSLLFTAGFLASQGILNEWLLVLGVALAAIGGDSVGYFMGNKFGRWLMRRKESFFFRKEYIEAARKFYKKHGGKALVLARFVPAVRTFVPIVAGMAEMHYRTFLSFNVMGGFLWAVGISMAGFFLGRMIPDVDRFLLPIVLVIMFVSVLPGLVHMRKSLMKQVGEEGIWYFVWRQVRGGKKEKELLD